MAQSIAKGCLLLILALVPAAALAEQDRASVGQEIVIPAGTTANDIACAFCSVHIHGTVSGDVAVLFGDVELDPGQEISGDVAVLDGKVALGEGARIGGDLAMMGKLHEGEGATIDGNRAVLAGWLWPITLGPLLILIGLIWLIVHLVRRRRFRARYPI